MGQWPVAGGSSTNTLCYGDLRLSSREGIEGRWLHCVEGEPRGFHSFYEGPTYLLIGTQLHVDPINSC